MSRSVGVLGCLHYFRRIEAVEYPKRCISTSFTKFNPHVFRIDRHHKAEDGIIQESSSPSVESKQSETDKPNYATADPVVLKYTNFVNSLRNGNVQEKVYDTNFGNIRFDTENIPVVHGQFENTSKESPDKEMDNLAKYELGKQENVDNTNNLKEDMNFVDQVWFGESHENYKDNASQNKDINEKIDNSQGVQSDLNFIDEGFFGEAYDKALKNMDNQSQNIISSSDVIAKDHGVVIDTKDLGVIDLAYFNESFDRINESKKPSIEFQNIRTDFEKAILDMDEEGENRADKISDKEKLKYSDYLKYDDKGFNNEISSTSVNIDILKEFYMNQLTVSEEGQQDIKTDFESATIENKNEKNEIVSNFSTNIKDQSYTTFLDNNSLSKSEVISHSQLQAATEFSKTKPVYSKIKENVESNQKNNETAYDYVLNKRKQLEQEESRNMTEQNFDKVIQSVLSLDDKTHYDVLKLLKQSILYDNYDIVGVYKPYGMPIHPGTSGAKHVLTDYLEDLAKVLKTPKLYTIHRLDAETTGVLLLAKTPEMAEKLKGMFKKRHLTKKYFAITKGIPGQKQGILDIPIAEGMIDGRRRMALRPNVKGLKHSRGSSKLAITKYKVLSSVNSSSLMEVIPVTGVKHQIRVHLGFGLGTPVLGDHKYSHLKKIAPQKLSGDMLEHLQIPQSKVRKLPRFLHAKSIFIPEIIEGRNISIQAALPSYFTKALRMLELHRKRSRLEEKTENTITIL